VNAKRASPSIDWTLQRLLQRDPLVHAQLPPERHGDDGRDRHVAQAARLDEQQDDELADQRELRAGRVDDDEPVTQTAEAAVKNASDGRHRVPTP
jgi:hypothetical protein